MPGTHCSGSRSKNGGTFHSLRPLNSYKGPANANTNTVAVRLTKSAEIQDLFFYEGVVEWEGIITLIYCFTPSKAKKQNKKHGSEDFESLLTKTAF